MIVLDRVEPYKNCVCQFLHLISSKTHFVYFGVVFSYMICPHW
ncbi:hypothetical protein MtrunA17_Chr6g0450961 [Medicago truncatula]|uniref:Uncharacterized protein n=1 Tax=Medicago truncatula TaxID=3880 RepID=A0A396H972_MEDTR|nr:hypothetical protein MtrunA17_Chr6g0450961 [Medicago truncatula]